MRPSSSEVAHMWGWSSPGECSSLQCLCWPSVQSAGCPKRHVGDFHLGVYFFCLSVHHWSGTAREQNLVTAFGFHLPMRVFGGGWGFCGVAGPWPWISFVFSGPTALPKWPLASENVCVRVYACTHRERRQSSEHQPRGLLAFKTMSDHSCRHLQTGLKHSLGAKHHSRCYEECNEIWPLPRPSEVYSLNQADKHIYMVNQPYPMYISPVSWLHALETYSGYLKQKMELLEG